MNTREARRLYNVRIIGVELPGWVTIDSARNRESGAHVAHRICEEARLSAPLYVYETPDGEQAFSFDVKIHDYDCVDVLVPAIALRRLEIITEEQCARAMRGSQIR